MCLTLKFNILSWRPTDFSFSILYPLLRPGSNSDFVSFKKTYFVSGFQQTHFNPKRKPEFFYHVYKATMRLTEVFRER